jgi:hypothetical protein
MRLPGLPLAKLLSQEQAVNRIVTKKITPMSSCEALGQQRISSGSINEIDRGKIGLTNNKLEFIFVLQL